MISDEDKERVRQATDIVQLVGETVELRQRGREFWGCCPFHHEKTPSFNVSPQLGIFKCFGCGESGDAIGFLQKHEHFSFTEAIRWLAKRYQLQTVCSTPAHWPHSSTGRAIPVYVRIRRQLWHQALKHGEEKSLDDALPLYIIADGIGIICG